ncbi:MAG: hypothetical protein ED859_02305 [Desulfuromonadales bacterium]|nr:MAG: hypothetical protein ED859_02305 [Desulfuromonadales bacterium]
MLIRVRYQNNSYDMVKSWRLQEYIAAGKITAFNRGGEWVTVGRDPIRRDGAKGYEGPERRRQDSAFHKAA